jgi:hypothetical protein
MLVLSLSEADPISDINAAAEATEIPQCSSLSGSPHRLGLCYSAWIGFPGCAQEGST